MQGIDAVNHAAEYCGRAFMNQLDDVILKGIRSSEVIALGLMGPDGKLHNIKITVVTEPQVFGETDYGAIESSVTHGMKLLEGNDETTIPQDSDF